MSITLIKSIKQKNRKHEQDDIDYFKAERKVMHVKPKKNV